MKSADRITITIPRLLLRQIERIRRRTGETRSAVLRRIVRFSFQEMNRAQKARGQRDGYLRIPETGDEPLLSADAVARLWDEEAPFG